MTWSCETGKAEREAMDAKELIKRYDRGQRDFRKARLDGADLRRAVLYKVNLRAARLRGAILISADLSEANLRGADLRDAHLSFADLRGADLAGADLTDATVSDEQLGLAKSLKGAILPDGKKHR